VTNSPDGSAALRELFSAILGTEPGCMALTDGTRTMTFGEWWHKSALAESGLAELGSVVIRRALGRPPSEG
jgi:hypothetical protein